MATIPKEHITELSHTPSTTYDSDDELETEQNPRAQDSKSHARTDSRQPLLPLSVTSASSATSLNQPSAVSQYWAKLTTLWQANIGFLFVIGASVFFCVINVIVAIFSTSDDKDDLLPTCELMFIRMSITGIGCYVYMKLAGIEYPALGPPEIRKMLVVRGSVGFFGIASLYYSLGYLSLSDSVCLTFITPLTTGIMSYFLLGESYTLAEGLAAIVSLLGVVLIAKPSALFDPADATPIMHEGRPVTEAERVRAVFISLVGVCGATGAYLSIRKIGTKAKSTHSILYFSYYTCFFSVILTIFIPSQRPVIPKANFLILLGSIGVLGFLAQVMLTLGLQKERAGRATIATYIQMPMTLIFERIVFHRTPDVLSLLGSTIIMSSAIATVVRKQRQAVSKEGKLTQEEQIGDEEISTASGASKRGESI